MYERREFPRRDVRKLPLRVVIKLQGTSLIKKEEARIVEIETEPINLSEGGICLKLHGDAAWQTVHSRELDLSIERKDRRKSFRTRIAFREDDGKILGLQFKKPFTDMAVFLGSNG